MNRRDALTSIGTLSVVALAGCTDIVFEDGVELEAQPAEVDPDVLDETSYEHAATESYRLEEEFEIGGESREVNATSWIAAYGLNVDMDSGHDAWDDQDIAGFAAISTPNETLAGRDLNPVAHLNDEELIEEFSNEVNDGEIKDVEKAGEREVVLLGEETTLTVFDAVVDVEGDEHDVALYVADVNHEGDMVITVGFHHTALDEEDSIVTLVEGTAHPITG